MHGKVDNDLKIASSSCRHVFIFVKSIKSNILVEISLTTCFFFRRPPLGLTLWQRHVIWWVQISKIQNTKYKYTCSIIIIKKQNEERKLKHPFYSLTMTSPISYVSLNFSLDIKVDIFYIIWYFEPKMDIFWYLETKVDIFLLLLIFQLQVQFFTFETKVDNLVATCGSLWSLCSPGWRVQEMKVIVWSIILMVIIVMIILMIPLLFLL